MAYADVSDLESRWRELSTGEESRAGVLLEDASAMLATLVAVDEGDEQQAAILKIVACNMVKRSMSSGDMEGLSSMSQTIGSTTASVSWSNPDGTLYLTRNEKRMLGIGGGRVGWASMAGDGDA